MIEILTQWTGFGAGQLALVTAVVFLAGLVRGFAGFALSAIVMAALAARIAPIELIPVCYLLEATASIAMFRGGMQDADMRIVWGLVIGSAIGTPIGLLATTSLDPALSKSIALAIVMTLAVAQLGRFRPGFLATAPGLYATGLVAGIVTGLASVGGLVVALYVLASNQEARKMRASLVMFLFFGMFTSILYLLAYGMMTPVAIIRGVLLAPVVLAGVFVGSLFFNPEKTRTYRSFCLLLLIGLSAAGLASQFG